MYTAPKVLTQEPLPIGDWSLSSLFSSVLLLSSIPIYIVQVLGYRIPYGKFSESRKAYGLSGRWTRVIAHTLPVLVTLYFAVRGDLVAPLFRRSTVDRLPYVPKFLRNVLYKENSLNQWMFYHTHTHLGVQEYVEPHAWLNLVALGMFALHHLYLGWVAPFQVTKPARMSFVVFLAMCAFNCLNAFSICSSLASVSSRAFIRIRENLAFATNPFRSMEFTIAGLGFSLFWIGFTMNILANGTLTSLRKRALQAFQLESARPTSSSTSTSTRGSSAKSTPTRGINTSKTSSPFPSRESLQVPRILHATAGYRYVLPIGGLFDLLGVSCPNYLGTVIQWIGYAMFTRTFPSVAFALFTFLYLLPRAQQVHKWYTSTFQYAYPSGSRNPLLPHMFTAFWNLLSTPSQWMMIPISSFLPDLKKRVKQWPLVGKFFNRSRRSDYLLRDDLSTDEDEHDDEEEEDEEEEEVSEDYEGEEAASQSRYRTRNKPLSRSRAPKTSHVGAFRNRKNATRASSLSPTRSRRDREQSGGGGGHDEKSFSPKSHASASSSTRRASKMDTNLEGKRLLKGETGDQEDLASASTESPKSNLSSRRRAIRETASHEQLGY